MYTMKISFKLVAIVLAVLFIIAISMGSCSRFTPYSFSTSTLHQYPYEGFRSSNEYTTYPQNAAIDSYESKLIASPSMGNAAKIGSFGLLSSPSAPETPIDIYSQAPGESTGKSYGYSNSMGPIQLNAEQLKLLTTRGGNMSGVDSTIGY